MAQGFPASSTVSKRLLRIKAAKIDRIILKGKEKEENMFMGGQHHGVCVRCCTAAFCSLSCWWLGSLYGITVLLGKSSKEFNAGCIKNLIVFMRSHKVIKAS